jgi:hypothetical protein
LIPSQAFIYLLITFGVIFFFHHFKQWKKTGEPSSSALTSSGLTRFKIYTGLVWIVSICLAILYWDGLKGSPLHLASYLIATALANTGLLLKMVVDVQHSEKML